MLKIIACLTMLIDHMGYVLFPGQFWMRIVGRIAFPLFAWYVARGFDRTRSRGRYLLRLLGWGLISQLPFVMLFYGGHWASPASLLAGTNVLFTFALALLALWVLKMAEPGGTALKIGAWLAVPALAFVAQLLHTDYGAYGVGVVILFHLFRDRPPIAAAVRAAPAPAREPGPATVSVPVATGPASARPGRANLAWGWLFMKRSGLMAALSLWTLLCLRPMGMHPIQLFCIAAVPLLWLRLPDPGPGRWKYAFYAFYPVHLTVLLLMTRL
jgi:hypothetical protein